AKRYGIDNPYDPVQGIYGGARILNDALTNAEQIKANGRDISPVDYALKTYFGGNEGPKWGPLTAAYPGKIAARYQALQGQGNAQPSGVDQLAAVGTKSPGIADGDNGQPYVVPAQYAEERAAQGPQSGSTLP